MSESKPEPTAEDPVEFLSLVTMRDTHRELLERRRVEGESGGYLTAVQDFLHRGQASGAYFDLEADREAAQSMLDYWENFLFHAGMDPHTMILAEFDVQRAPTIPESKRPYVGLEPFRPEDRHRFFGRSQLIQDMMQQVEANRFIAVIGPSGSGKSSVVMAGLLPSLQRGSLPDSANWHYLRPIVPGSAPLVSLARLFQPTDTGTDWVIQTTERLYQNRYHLAELANQHDQPVVLLIDQFEELFTLCFDETERQAFIDNVMALSQDRQKPHRVIITMRTDYESYLSKHPLLQSMFEQGEVRVSAMTAGELREAIEGPAEAINLKFDEGLVDKLIREILGEPAALPLLQFALLKLWQNREHNRITWQAYQQVGSVMQALANTADETFDSLIPEEKRTARRIFLRIVRPSAGLEVTRNRVRRKMLYQDGEASDRVDRVLTKLVDANLIRLTSGATPEDDQVEVAHEALVRNWPRLVEWLDEERVRLRQRYRLATLAAEWDHRNRDAELLLRGDLLREARMYDDLNPLESAFIEASTAAEREQARLEEERRQRELVQAKELAAEKTKAARRLRYFNVALGMAVLGLVVGIVLYANINALNEQAAESEIMLLAQENERLAAEATARALASTSTVEAGQAQSTIMAQAAEATEVQATSTSEAVTRQVEGATATAEFAVSQEQISQRATVDAVATETAFMATATVQRVTVEAQVAEATAAAENVTGPGTPEETPTITAASRLEQYALVAVANSYVRPQDNMTMLLVTGDSFLMGDGRTATSVKVDSFYIDQFEVSVQQFAKFLNAIGGYRTSCGDGGYCAYTRYEILYTFLLNNLGIYEASAGFGSYPANWITWDGANDYCAWAYPGGRLPTAAEWEYAARGLDGRLYPWGNDPASLSLAVYRQRLQPFTVDGPLRRVDALPDGTSPFGVFGMAGSVAEWVLPMTPDVTQQTAVSATQLIRGGSWSSTGDEITVVASREVPVVIPETVDDAVITLYAGIGFRCAIDASAISISSD